MSRDFRRRRNLRARYLLSALGIRNSGFFTPYAYLSSADWDAPPYPAILDRFAALQDRFEGFVSAIRRFSPARVIEIGSGISTRFIARAVADGGLATDIACIDPQRRIEIESLPVCIGRRVLSVVDVETVAGLEAGYFARDPGERRQHLVAQGASANQFATSLR